MTFGDLTFGEVAFGDLTFGEVLGNLPVQSIGQHYQSQPSPITECWPIIKKQWEHTIMDYAQYHRVSALKVVSASAIRHLLWLTYVALPAV